MEIWEILSFSFFLPGLKNETGNETDFHGKENETGNETEIFQGFQSVFSKHREFLVYDIVIFSNENFVIGGQREKASENVNYFVL